MYIICFNNIAKTIWKNQSNKYKHTQKCLKKFLIFEVHEVQINYVCLGNNGTHFFFKLCVFVCNNREHILKDINCYVFVISNSSFEAQSHQKIKKDGMPLLYVKFINFCSCK